jgi:hypothetical protein
VETHSPLPYCSLEQAAHQLATHLNTSYEQVLTLMNEDTVGGFQLDDVPQSTPRWEGGSVFESEGQLLYALVRTIRPRVIVEVGSFRGCSTSHLALACQRNGRGVVFAVDPWANFSQVRPELLPFVRPVAEDILRWQPPPRIDFLFEDGQHTPGFTRSVLERLLPRVRGGGGVAVHDYYSSEASNIAPDVDELLGPGAQTVVVPPSNCGLAYVRIASRPWWQNGWFK